MRKQELIYVQNDGFARNKDILNISTSSDICVFESPWFDMSGATKIVTGMTSGNTGMHLIDNSSEFIDLVFDFSANLDSLNGDTKFSYDIFKYDDNTSIFREPPVISSTPVVYSSFSGTNILYDSVPVNNMPDGEYLIKGKYDHKVCTYIFNQLGLRNTTESVSANGEYYLYNDNYDYYFAAIYKARTPIFDLTPANDRALGSLNVLTILPAGKTSFTIADGINGQPVVTLNGLVLVSREDYTLSGNTINLLGPTYADDTITLFYVGAGSQNGLVATSHAIDKPILSGTTDNQGNESVYYNITTEKYEIFTDTDPISKNDIIISINGAVLANNIDYYQSVSNKRRIILEGNLVFGDIVTIVYNGKASYVGAVMSNSLTIYWTIDLAPQKENGKFIVQLSSSKDFTSISSSAETSYVISNRVYKAILGVSGSVGQKMYYRVINEKNYETLIGDVITTTATSEVIPITIQSNSLNNY